MTTAHREQTVVQHNAPSIQRTLDFNDQKKGNDDECKKHLGKGNSDNAGNFLSNEPSYKKTYVLPPDRSNYYHNKSIINEIRVVTNSSQNHNEIRQSKNNNKIQESHKNNSNQSLANFVFENNFMGFCDSKEEKHQKISDQEVGSHVSKGRSMRGSRDPQENLMTALHDSSSRSQNNSSFSSTFSSPSSLINNTEIHKQNNTISHHISYISSSNNCNVILSNEVKNISNNLRVNKSYIKNNQNNENCESKNTPPSNSIDFEKKQRNESSSSTRSISQISNISSSSTTSFLKCDH